MCKRLSRNVAKIGDLEIFGKEVESCNVSNLYEVPRQRALHELQIFALKLMQKEHTCAISPQPIIPIRNILFSTWPFIFPFAMAHILAMMLCYDAPDCQIAEDLWRSKPVGDELTVVNVWIKCILKAEACKWRPI
jgi:hypothetical protein